MMARAGLVLFGAWLVGVPWLCQANGFFAHATPAPKPLADCYRFSPEPSITPYELALILDNASLEHGGDIRRIVIPAKVYATLSPAITRHFVRGCE